uniref:MADF domain-containing protein n=1 Tax=Strongyloides stercoralis TaxID=6248 RepID=A0A0K0E860_STRER
MLIILSCQPICTIILHYHKEEIRRKLYITELLLFDKSFGVEEAKIDSYPSNSFTFLHPTPFKLDPMIEDMVFENGENCNIKSEDLKEECVKEEILDDSSDNNENREKSNSPRKLSRPELETLGFQLIRKVKSEPCLYDSNNPYYGNKPACTAYRLEIWKRFAVELNFPGGGPGLQIQWKRLRDRYVKLRKKRKLKKNCYPQENNTIGSISSAKLFEEMKWIDPYLVDSDSNPTRQVTAKRRNQPSKSLREIRTVDKNGNPVFVKNGQASRITAKTLKDLTAHHFASNVVNDNLSLMDSISSKLTSIKHEESEPSSSFLLETDKNSVLVTDTDNYDLFSTKPSALLTPNLHNSTKKRKVDTYLEETDHSDSIPQPDFSLNDSHFQNQSSSRPEPGDIDTTSHISQSYLSSNPNDISNFDLDTINIDTRKSRPTTAFVLPGTFLDGEVISQEDAMFTGEIVGYLGSASDIEKARFKLNVQKILYNVRISKLSTYTNGEVVDIRNHASSSPHAFRPPPRRRT